MQYRVIKQVLGRQGWFLAFCILFATSKVVSADAYYQQAAPERYQEHYFTEKSGNAPSGYQNRYQGNTDNVYSRHQQDDNHSNPWALPPVYDDSRSFGQRYDYSRQRFEGRKNENRRSGYRFVTPEFLQSLKQQQMQVQHQQVAPAQNYRNAQRSYRYSMPESSVQDHPIPIYPPSLPEQGRYGQGVYGPRSYGMESYERGVSGLTPYDTPMSGMPFADSLYDAPAVSPWGNAPDVIYRGQEFPWLPNEAIGGLSPIEAPLELQWGDPAELMTGSEPRIPGDKNDLSGNENGIKQKRSGVFNPYDFAPNSNRY